MKADPSILHILAHLVSQPVFTVAEAKRIGVSRQMLAYYAKRGLLERVHPGTYRSIHHESSFNFEWEGLAEAAMGIPNSVICLISALHYYRLTDQVMRESWIAVPHRQRAAF